MGVMVSVSSVTSVMGEHDRRRCGLTGRVYSCLRLVDASTRTASQVALTGLKSRWEGLRSCMSGQHPQVAQVQGKRRAARAASRRACRRARRVCFWAWRETNSAGNTRNQLLPLRAHRRMSHCHSHTRQTHHTFHTRHICHIRHARHSRHTSTPVTLSQSHLSHPAPVTLTVRTSPARACS